MKNSLLLSAMAIVGLTLLLCVFPVYGQVLIEAEPNLVLNGSVIQVRIVTSQPEYPEVRHGQTVTVRYLGINPIGNKATELNTILTTARTLYLEMDNVLWDQDGRLLAYAYLDPERLVMINSLLVAAGLAETLPETHNLRHESILAELEETAKQLGLGYWRYQSPGQVGGSWIAPSLEPFCEAAKWGADQTKDLVAFWTVCEYGPCRLPQEEWEGRTLIFVGTPLAMTAIESYRTGGLNEREINECKEVYSNKLTISLIFEGTTITQGTSVLQPFESSLDYEIVEYPNRLQFSLVNTFMVQELDANKPFWFSAAQVMGQLKFRFKIDPRQLGSKDFF